MHSELCIRWKWLMPWVLVFYFLASNCLKLKKKDFRNLTLSLSHAQTQHPNGWYWTSPRRPEQGFLCLTLDKPHWRVQICPKQPPRADPRRRQGCQACVEFSSSLQHHHWRRSTDCESCLLFPSKRQSYCGVPWYRTRKDLVFCWHAHGCCHCQSQWLGLFISFFHLLLFLGEAGFDWFWLFMGVSLFPYEAITGFYVYVTKLRFQSHSGLRFSV